MDTPSYQGEWSSIEIAGKHADVYEPPGDAPPRFALIYLHGNGMISLKDNPVYSALFDRYQIPVVCPRGERSWWLDLVCTEFDEELTAAKFVKENVVQYCQEKWQVTPPAIGIFGVSMGGQGALQIAYRDARSFPVVAAISPAVDFQRMHGQQSTIDLMFENAEAARQQTVTLHLHPLNWPKHQMFLCDTTDVDWFEGTERLVSKLSSMGTPFEKVYATNQGGHSWDYFNSVAETVVTYLAEKLEVERQRV